MFVCVSEMDSLWPERINSLPDWLQLSRNVTGEPERDLIAIRELPPSSRGQRARHCNNPSKHPSLCEPWTGLQLDSGWELLISQGVFNRCGGRGCGQTGWPDELYFYSHNYSALKCALPRSSCVQRGWRCTLRWSTGGVSPAASYDKLSLLRKRCEGAKRSTDDLWSSGTTDSPVRGREVESVCQDIELKPDVRDCNSNTMTPACCVFNYSPSTLTTHYNYII